MREDISTLSRCQCDNEDVNTLRLFMDIGAMMIRNGSEVKRVEDTLRRMGKAYGAERTDPAVDVVYIGSIHPLHAQHIRAALLAGCGKGSLQRHR